MIISIIAAVSENGVIGNGNRLLWKLSDDLRHFKKLTLGRFVIMGRNTFNSIGKPLKGRTNIVLTRNDSLKIEGVTIIHSLPGALEFARNQNQNEVFIIGGADLYRQAYPLTGKIYYTKVAADLKGDACFPEIDWNAWAVISGTSYEKDDKNEFSFQIFEMERLK